MLGWLAGWLRSRTILHFDGRPSLYKYLLWQSGEGRDSVRLHLHHFVRSDADRDPHNHPWAWAVSLVLVGGYVEHRRVGVAGRYWMHKVRVRPGDLNFLGPNTFHRVELWQHDAWTLFLSGPVVQSWGFWSIVDGLFTPWRRYVVARGGQVPEGEYWKPTKPGAGS